MMKQDREAWVRRLGATPERQIAAIRVLLRHANGDGMSVEDRTTLRLALADLHGVVLVEDRTKRPYRRQVEANELFGGRREPAGTRGPYRPRSVARSD